MSDRTPEDVYTGKLIDAAEAYATAYDEDERDCIKTDVMNAFYAGAAWHAGHAGHDGAPCARCGKPLLDHDFGVPAPYCP